MERLIVRTSGLFEAAPQTTRTAFKSRDCDEVRAHVGEMFCEHSMRLVNRRSTLDTCVRRFDCRSLSISDMAYGADVLIDAGRFDDFYLVQIPLSGKAWVATAGQQNACLPGMGTVQNPEDPVEMYWSADCRKLVLRYERTTFERFVEFYSGQGLRSALRLDPTIDFSGSVGAVFQRQLVDIIGIVGIAGHQAGAVPQLLQAHIENCLMSSLLLLQPNDRTDAFRQTDLHAVPQAVRRVRDFLHEHAQDPIDAATLGRVAGVPLRTLHHQFKRSLGQTPMQLLREIRLDRVRAELLRGDAGGSVTQIALNWGFDHLGRFAASYRERFGESPRDTLQRCRLN